MQLFSFLWPKKRATGSASQGPLERLLRMVCGPGQQFGYVGVPHAL
jgi:hypothetical protein